MAFRQWLIGLLGGRVKNDPDQAFILPPPAGVSAEEEEIDGLNFRTAIEAHQK